MTYFFIIMIYFKLLKTWRVSTKVYIIHPSKLDFSSAPLTTISTIHIPILKESEKIKVKIIEQEIILYGKLISSSGLKRVAYSI